LTQTIISTIIQVMIYIAFLIFTFIILLFAFYQWQYFMVFTPVYYRKDILDDSFEILSITSDDGVELEGVVYEPQNPKTTLLFFPGRNHDSVGLVKKLSISFPDIRIITFNYRSYGRSGGVINEKNIFQDGVLVANMVKKHYGQFYILGFSIGSSVASYVASQVDTLSLFLIGAFDNIAKLAKRRFHFDISWLYRYRFDTLKFVQQVKSKTYLFVSQDDELTYIENARNLKKYIKNLVYYKEYVGLTHKELLWNEEIIKKINEELR